MTRLLDYVSSGMLSLSRNVLIIMNVNNVEHNTLVKYGMFTSNVFNTESPKIHSYLGRHKYSDFLLVILCYIYFKYL